MKTTLREIYKHRPCREGFARLIYTMTGEDVSGKNIVEQFDLVPEEIMRKYL